MRLRRGDQVVIRTGRAPFILDFSAACDRVAMGAGSAVQVADANKWREQILKYFAGFSKRPIPASA